MPVVGIKGLRLIEEVAVLGSSRYDGVGSQLVTNIVEWMLEKGFTRIGVTSLADEAQTRREIWCVRLGFVKSDSGMYEHQLEQR